MSGQDVVIAPEVAGLPWPCLDLAASIECAPPALDFVLPGLVSGTVGAIVAPGATGKSWLALELLALIAADTDLLGLGRQKQGCVVLLAAEDPAEVLHARVHALAQHLTPAARENIKENAFVLPCLGRGGDLLDGGETVARIEHVAGGARLVILDTLSRWHTGDENDRSDAARVMRALERVAARTGAAIVFLHHTSKAAALEGRGDRQQASRGSSVFVDEARWVAFIQTMTDDEARAAGVAADRRRDFVRYGLSKANYCPPQPDAWMRREDGGVLVRYELRAVGGQAKPATTRKAGNDDYADF